MAENVNKGDGDIPVTELDHIIPPEDGEKPVIHKLPILGEDTILFPEFPDVIVIGKPVK